MVSVGMVGCMKFLLTNDDGIDAPGLKLLAEVVAQLGDVLIVAPVEEGSNDVPSVAAADAMAARLAACGEESVEPPVGDFAGSASGGAAGGCPPRKSGL